MAEAPEGAATELRYRNAHAPERMTWGTHCSNCLATCCYKVFASGEEVLWQEQAGTFPAIDPGVPDRNPMGCQKGAAWSIQRDSGDRFTHPLQRVGERGSGEWEQITWDEALEMAAGGILDAIEESGPEAVLVDEGPEGGMLTILGYLRFANVLGAVSLDGNATVNDFPAGHYLTFGSFAGGSAADDTFNSELILIWHANPAYTRIPYFHYIAEARYGGAEVVLIAPDFSPSAPHTDKYIPVKPGTDAALAMSMAHVVIDEGLIDEDFVCSQTDLPLLVRTDTGTLLREVEIAGTGSNERFYVWNPSAGTSGGLDMVPYDTLEYGFRPALEGEYSAALADGSNVTVTPVFELLRRRIEEFAPETASKLCGVNPDTIRDLARAVATKRTKYYEGFDTAKHFNGDLMERSADLLLALTGNWGRPGTGFDTFVVFPFDGAYLLELKARAGVEAAAEVIDQIALNSPDFDPEGTGPVNIDVRALRQVNQATAGLGSTTPPFFLWLNHCGYREIWEKNEWSGAPRPFAEYLDEALGQWRAFDRPGPGQKPRVLIEAGTNALRRTRGGQRMLLENLWPELNLIISLDNRINTAGMHADLLLPAAHEDERINLQYPISHSFELAFSDQTVAPRGEAKSDWQIFRLLAERVASLAVERGIGDRTVGRIRPKPLSRLGDAFTLGGALSEDEAVVEEMVRDSALSGLLDEDLSLSKLRETGWAPIAGNGAFPSGILMGSQAISSEIFVGLRFHVERSLPYPTLTGRATFFIDHPWFIEAGEDLPTHKDPPAMGGDHPFMMTGGHPRWSIHACNATNPVMLGTTRGHPTIGISRADATSLGIADDSLVEISNDVGSFVVSARVSGAVRPGQVVMYSSWEPYAFAGWRDSTLVEPGMVKWLHLATGWGHLHYTPFQWQPTQFDRTTRVQMRPVSSAKRD